MLLFVASALLGASAEPAVAPAPAPAAKPKRVCHVEEAVTGSLTPKRICITVPQAAPQQKPAQEASGDKPQQASSGGSGDRN